MSIFENDEDVVEQRKRLLEIAQEVNEEAKLEKLKNELSSKEKAFLFLYCQTKFWVMYPTLTDTCLKVMPNRREALNYLLVKTAPQDFSIRLRRMAEFIPELKEVLKDVFMVKLLTTVSSRNDKENNDNTVWRVSSCKKNDIDTVYSWATSDFYYKWRDIRDKRP